MNNTPMRKIVAGALIAQAIGLITKVFVVQWAKEVLEAMEEMDEGVED